ncbi:fatty acid-binding protein [Corynebacterium sp. HMSC05H05]|uniref:FABP family protein n=1 Tax=unclassified Corynebacterium TaxID=2624378 RepID=UPI0008A283B6|nr:MULTISPECIES: FABP family protein [unclassified Corynebacterium]OFT57921.1 fatty acid-binding protein [Corynebacterium sp. HMSC05H05]OHR24209.1 fatty acid-binding protein [Corynebacterium sp. HMSC034A01]
MTEENRTEENTLNGNDAVNLAAEQSKNTAHRNIPELGFEEMPLEADTANLRFGPSLHDGLLALLPLVGVWTGSGQANDPSDPEGEEYAFGQQLVVSHDGENYLRFESRIWRLDSEGNATGADQREVGFWRISLKDEIEVTLTNSRGLVEIMYGGLVNERAWQLTSASTIATETGPAAHGPGKRLYGLMPNNNLGWVDERAVDGEMVPYMSAELKRVAG